LNIWFMIWVFVAVFILGTSVWSFYILFQQKKAWDIFAKKFNLEFVPSAVFKSPLVRGMFRDCYVDIFSDRQLSGNERVPGMRTVFQLKLKAPMATEGVVASGTFRNFVNGLLLKDLYVPDSEGWNKDIYIRVQNMDSIKPYFTKERLAVFNSLMSIKNSPALLIFSDTETILRIESADPFSDVDKLERFLIKITDASKIISI
jgi:hypothetical protein